MATDPVIKDHQLWIGFAQPEGLVVSPHALKNAQAVLSRNVGVQQEIVRRHALPDLDGSLRLKDFPAFTQEFWGWRESDLTTPPDDLFARLPEYGEALRPTWVVRGGKGQPENLILVEELPWRTDFDKPGPTSEERRWHASHSPASNVFFAKPAFPSACSFLPNESDSSTLRKESLLATSHSPSTR
jgi:hypothetical protein